MLLRLGDQGLVELEPSTLKEAGWSEKDLENMLAENLQYVIAEDQLFLLKQERRGQEMPDILALDREGGLFIFELKKDAARSDHLLQVLRYGQIYGQYDFDELETLYHEDNPRGIALAAAHCGHFGLEEELPRDGFNRKQQFVLVTAGYDAETLSAVDFWKEKNLAIDAACYYVYKDNDSKSFYIEWDRYAPKKELLASASRKHFIVNTNVSYDTTAYLEMIGDGKEGRAAAYGGRKTSVDVIPAGATVFLYHVGVGVIAKGEALRRFEKAENEHYVPLRFSFCHNPLTEPEKCVSASEINRSLGRSNRFRLTCFAIDGEMAKAITGLLAAKQDLPDRQHAPTR